MLLLPLTNAVGESIIEYLTKGRPEVHCREIFVRHQSPRGTLKSTAISEAFQAWSRRSGLEIPFQGPHCIRHSFAVHLLRQGTSLKTIGDILGHRDIQSTCVYLRLNIEDLRTVPLCMPTLS
jgi:integrase/recombinase XerD